MRDVSILIADMLWALIFFSTFYFNFLGQYVKQIHPQMRKGLLTVIGYYCMAAILWQFT